MSVFDRFWSEYLKAFQRLPVWLPGTDMQLGDVGLMEKRGWQKVTTLETMGVDFTVRQVPSDVSYSYASADSVDISALANTEAGEGTSAGEVVGGMNLAFKREGAFVVRAENCEHSAIDNLGAVQDQLFALDGTVASWRDKRWVLTSEVTTAAPFIVLVAQAGGAEATLEMRSTAGAAGLASIASGHGSIRLTHESSLDTRFLSVQRLPVMWRGRVHRRWPLRGWKDLGEEASVPREAAPDSSTDELVEFVVEGRDV